MSKLSYHEKILSASDGRPFGIVANPVSDRRETGVILLNSGLLHRVGPSRLYVTLSRRLAELGFVAARIDVAGKGDTPRRLTGDAKESLLLDYDQCCQAIQNQSGICSFILIGLCSGADDAFSIATERKNVAGMVMLDGYAARTWRYFLRHYSSRMFQLEPWLRIPGRLRNRTMQLLGRAEINEGELRMREIRNFPSVRVAQQFFAAISPRTGWIV